MCRNGPRDKFGNCVLRYCARHVLHSHTLRRSSRHLGGTRLCVLDRSRRTSVVLQWSVDPVHPCLGHPGNSATLFAAERQGIRFSKRDRPTCLYVPYCDEHSFDHGTRHCVCRSADVSIEFFVSGVSDGKRGAIECDVQPWRLLRLTHCGFSREHHNRLVDE